MFRMKEDLEGVLNSDFSGPTLVVFHLLDNSIYQASTRDGTRPAQRDSRDGKWHLEGKMKIMFGGDLEQLLHRTIPLIRATKQHRPTHQAYVASPCCENPDHISNFGSSRYLASTT